MVHKVEVVVQHKLHAMPNMTLLYIILLTQLSLFKNIDFKKIKQITFSNFSGNVLETCQMITALNFCENIVLHRCIMHN